MKEIVFNFNNQLKPGPCSLLFFQAYPVSGFFLLYLVSGIWNSDTLS